MSRDKEWGSGLPWIAAIPDAKVLAMLLASVGKRRSLIRNHLPGNVRWATPTEQRRNRSRATIADGKVAL